MVLLPAGAVDEQGQKPYYAEECASMLAVTFSSGGNKLRSIVSTVVRPMKTALELNTKNSCLHILDFGTMAVSHLDGV